MLEPIKVVDDVYCPLCNHPKGLHPSSRSDRRPKACAGQDPEKFGSPPCTCTLTYDVGIILPPESRLGITTEHKAGDDVDHPAHYNTHPSGIEAIEVVRHMTFNVGNAVKYCWRAGLKGTESPTKDLKKAIWYLQDEVARLEREWGK